ncbi:MAG: GIY-YIG nuclease family protein, partial [Magnetospirillum sp.]|nr:GIY-YIG nuclease family protein [Magnetospirillum sp.]
RAWEHKSDAIDGFTKKYGVHLLVYYEMHASMPDAILREKRMKWWNRAWKIELIERSNPQWRDLYEDVG